MENPATWTPLEHAIDKALLKARTGHHHGVIGLSEVRIIADAVREVYSSVVVAADFALAEAHRLGMDVQRAHNRPPRPSSMPIVPPTEIVGGQPDGHLEVGRHD